MVGEGNNLVKPENMDVETNAKDRTKRGVEKSGRRSLNRYRCEQVHEPAAHQRFCPDIIRTSFKISSKELTLSVNTHI